MQGRMTHHFLGVRPVVGHRVSKCECDGLLAIVDYQGWSRTPRVD